jgi:hypothetical protein
VNGAVVDLVTGAAFVPIQEKSSLKAAICLAAKYKVYSLHPCKRSANIFIKIRSFAQKKGFNSP